MTTDTPFVGNEKETLHAFLRKQRAVMLWKAEARVVVEQKRCAKTFVPQDPTRVSSPCDFYGDTAGL